MTGVGISSELDNRTKSPINSLLVAAATAGALLAGTPGYAQVTDNTRKAVAELQASDPAFKLKTFHRGCLDGSIIDSNCEEGVKGHMDIYLKRKEVNAERAQVNAERAQVNAREAQVNAREAQVNAREAQVNAERAQLAILDEIIFNLDISLAMLQLANYIEFNEPIPKDKDTVAMIINSDKAPAEVKVFLKNTLAKKKAGIAIKYNPEGKELLGYVKTYTDAAMNLMGKVTIRDKTYENLEKQIAVTRQNYMTVVGIFSRKEA